MRIIDRCGALMAVLILASASASAQDRARIANASTAGQWWVSFRVYTKPGGEAFIANPGTPHATNHSGYHVEFWAITFFTVGNESRFHFDERRGGFHHYDSDATVISTGVGYNYSGDYQPILKGDGLVDGGTVRLLLKWSAGNGVTSVSGSPGTQTVSADGLQATVTGGGKSYSIPNHHYSSEWQLERTSVSPPLDANDHYETITYKTTRSAVLPFHPNVGARGVPVTEEIEVVHLHPVQREGAQPPAPPMADVAIMLSAALTGAAADGTTAAKVGEPISLVATVTNHGPRSARRVSATLAIPPALELHGLPALCRRASPGTARCEIGDLANSASRQIEFAVKPRRPSAPVVTAAIESVTADPDRSNNTTTANLRVAP